MHSEGEASSSKKRKVQRACDFCRRRKIKCDGPQTHSDRCYNCTSCGVECTYIQTLPRRTYPSSYVEGLQNRLERMEKLVGKLFPGGDTSGTLEGSQLSDRTHPPQAAASSRRDSPRSLSPPPLTVAPQTPIGSGEPDPSDDDADDVANWLTDGISKLTLGTQASRYHGKSSGILFIRDVLELKDEIAPDQSKWQERPERFYPWLRPAAGEELPVFEDFPPDDLMNNLVELYFRRMNEFVPLLNETIFKKGIESNLHLRNGGFGATVLLVCATGSQFTRDPRVFVSGTDREQSAGWKWFHQVERVRKPPLAPAQLYDLQTYILMVFFLQWTAAPQTTWMLVGIGMRAAIDVGAHRRRMYSTPPTPEQELWKRAFWILVVLDWSISYGLGRPASIHDEDFDVVLPIEVDDEYWVTDDGQPLFKQPPEKPAKITSFNYFIRLIQMLAFAGRTLYSINKSKIQLVRGEKQWEHRILAELDSALNKWVASLPSHLRWDPNQQNVLFLNQAAWLFASYNQFQIAFHRPFISAPRREPSSSVPSLIICTHAARASIQVLDTLNQRTGSPHCSNMGALFMSGIVLMMNVLGDKRSGRKVHTDRDLVYVQKCMDMLKLLHPEMAISRSLWEILNDLMTAASAPPPALTSPSPSAPREGIPRKAETTTATSSASTVAFDINHQPVDAAVVVTSQGRPGVETQPGPPFTSITSAHSGFQSTSQPPNVQQTPDILASSFGHTDLFNPTLYSDGSPQQAPLSVDSSGQPASLQRQVEVESNVPSQTTGSPDPEIDFGLTDDGSMSMFGLEPLGYSETVPWQHPPPPAHGAPADGPAYAPQDLQSQLDAWIAMNTQGGDAEARAMPDIDGALTMWSSAPTTFGWDDWVAYRNNVNDPSHSSPSGSG